MTENEELVTREELPDFSHFLGRDGRDGIALFIFLFKDKISWINILGIVVCFVGLIMLNWKR